MGEKVTLNERGLTSVNNLTLHDTYVTQKGDLLSAKRELSLGQVVAILRDAEQVHIVGPGEPISFTNRPGKADFEYFLDQLIQRVVSL